MCRHRNIHATAFDADHNVIVGAGDYDTPILLSISDPASSGTISLSTPVLQNPSMAANLIYNGGTLSTANSRRTGKRGCRRSGDVRPDADVL